MGGGAEGLAANPEAQWRIVREGPVTWQPTGRIHDVLSPPVAVGHYYDVAGPESASDEPVALVEFIEHDDESYAGARKPAVELVVSARRPDGDLLPVITGTTRLRYLADVPFILRAARLGVELATEDNPAQHAATLEALLTN